MSASRHLKERIGLGLTDQTRRPNTCVIIGDSHVANSLYAQTSLNSVSAAGAGTAYTGDLGRRVVTFTLSASAGTGQALAATVDIETSLDNSTWTTLYTANLSIASYSAAQDTVVAMTQDQLYIRANCTAISGTNARITTAIRGFPQSMGQGPFTVCNGLLGNRLLVLANYGIGGQTSTEIAARFTTDVLSTSPKPGWVVILAGENDGDVSVTTITNLTQMYDTAKLLDINVIAYEMYPVGVTYNTAGDTTARRAVNRFIRQYCEVNPHAICVSPFQELLDTSTLALYSGGRLSTSYSGDEKHLNPAGGCLVGRKGYATLDSVIPHYPRNSFDPFDGTNGDPYAIVVNGGMWGTGGTKTAGSGGSPTPTGDVADNWTVTTSNSSTTTGVACSKVARSDGLPGYVQRIAVTGEGSGGSSYVNFSSTTLTPTDTYLAPGSRGWFEFDIDYNASTGNLYFLQCQVTVYRNGSYGESYVVTAFRADGTNPLLTSFCGVLATPIFVVPSWPTAETRRVIITMRMGLTTGADGTFDVYGVRYRTLDSTLA